MQSSLDHSLFIKKQGTDIVVILVYVDDMLVAGSNLTLIEQTKASLHKAFKIKDIGDLKFFLGMEFSRSGKGILVNQRKYVLEIISQLGIGSAKPSWTPLETNIKITTHELDNLIGESDEELLENKEQYQSLVGKMLYLTLTRPDIAFSVQTLSQFLQQPKKSHWEAALRVMKYVKREPGLGILLSSTRTNTLTVFCDADWASCPNTRRSVSGFLVKHGNSLISWKSKKQSVVSRSSAKAEYKSMANEVSEVVWITTLLKELGSELDEPVVIFSDSKEALQIAANPVFHERTKHIEIDCHFIRQKIQEGLVKTEYVNSKNQLADILTKGLPRIQHEYLVGKLGVLNVFVPTSLRGSDEIQEIT